RSATTSATTPSTRPGMRSRASERVFSPGSRRMCLRRGRKVLRRMHASTRWRRSNRMAEYTPTEMMTVAAARALKSSDVCFVGIGMPSAAANLARLSHAPQITLIYESGTLGTRPAVLPLSIGDGELCETALTTVSVPEMFRYWLMGGRISIGFLGGAQIDRF